MKYTGGIIIPAVTPFREDGTIAFDLMEKNYEAWNKTSVAGYMCLGSNGEFRMLDDDEAFEVIRRTAELACPKKTLIAGVARESLVHTLKFIDRVLEADLPIDYLSLLTPHYFKGLMTDEALIQYYTRIADHSTKPVMLYCAPNFANSVCISAEAVKALADHPNIHGIKDTSTDMMSAYMQAAGGRDDFEIVSGSMSTVIACMDQGGKGGVVSAANYFPEECSEVVRLYNEEGRQAAVDYYSALNVLIKKTGARGSVAGVKCCMNLVGLGGGVPRLPVLPVADSIREEMRQALVEAGKIQ